MTGRELWQLLGNSASGFFSKHWDDLQPEERQTLNHAADDLDKQQAERICEATAGEDI